MDSDSNKQSIRVIASGLVQGVGYRWHILNAAADLVGTVRNLRDGSVEIRAEGEEDALVGLIAVAWRGPALARVKALDIEWDAAVGAWTDFQVIS